MGMTDRQFDVHQKNMLRELKRAQAELAQAGTKSVILDELIDDIEEQLKRP